MNALRPDRRSLDRILAMNDAQLRTLIEKLTRDYGLDLSAFSVNAGDLEGLRRALRNASDEDLSELTRQIRGGR